MENLNSTTTAQEKGAFMANFGFDDLAADAIQPRTASLKEVERIFDKYVRQTLEKIELSISDAKGRYEEGKAYTDPKPSKLWKVVKKADTLEEEKVEIKLVIGIKKQVLFTKDGVDHTSAKIKSPLLLKYLEAFKQKVEYARDNPTSDFGKEFHQSAIDAALPKSKPSPKTNPGKTDWEYDADSDTYIAI